MGLRIDLENSKILSVNQSSRYLEIHFEFSIVAVKDPLSSSSQSNSCRRGFFKLTNAKYTILPIPGSITDGSIQFGDLSFQNHIPLDTKIYQRSALKFKQNNNQIEIFADSIDLKFNDQNLSFKNIIHNRTYLIIAYVASGSLGGLTRVFHKDLQLPWSTSVFLLGCTVLYFIWTHEDWNKFEAKILTFIFLLSQFYFFIRLYLYMF